MNMFYPKLRRALLPVEVFAGVFAIHFLWVSLLPGEQCDATCATEATANNCAAWLPRYIESQSYWLGYSYGLSLAFAAVALRRYREQRLCSARTLAVGGVTLSGALAVVGCFLLGCCGSPMLPVYLSLFGATFLPLAKPLMAGLTTVMILASAWWLRRRAPLVCQTANTTPATPPSSTACS